MKEIYLPSAPHGELAKLSGAWEQRVTIAGPNGNDVIIAGRVENSMIVGNRFLVSSGTSKQTEKAFVYDATLVFGFDGRTREYTVVVMDTMGTYYVTAAGGKVDGANRVVMSGETAEGSGTKRFDVVLTWLTPDLYTTEIVFNVPGRGPVRAVSTEYRRVAQAP